MPSLFTVIASYTKNMLFYILSYPGFYFRHLTNHTIHMLKLKFPHSFKKYYSEIFYFYLLPDCILLCAITVGKHP